MLHSKKVISKSCMQPDLSYYCYKSMIIKGKKLEGRIFFFTQYYANNFRIDNFRPQKSTQHISI